MYRESMKHVTCLLCAQSFNRRGFGKHLHKRNHRRQGKKWWTYDAKARVMMDLLNTEYVKAMTENLLRNFRFKEEFSEAKRATLPWFRYES